MLLLRSEKYNDSPLTILVSSQHQKGCMRTHRLFLLLDQLRGRRHPVPAQELAEACKVSVRTIYRDMATLQELGVPVRGESGIGYQLESGFFLPPLHFDQDELAAIMLGMRIVAARGDDTLALAARKVTDKVAAVMPDDRRRHFERLPFRAASSLRDTQVHVPGMLHTLRVAIREYQYLQIHYTDLQQNASERTIRPLGLTMFDQTWLLTAWCEKRHAFRHFRVDRIAHAVLPGTHFLPETGKRFEDYLKQL